MPPRTIWSQRQVGCRASWAVAILVPVGVAAAACGVSPSAVGPVVFHATIAVTGEIHTKESFTDALTAKKGSSCREAAIHGDRSSTSSDTWVVPTPPSINNSVEIQIGTSARGYHGPGHYPQSVLDGGDWGIGCGPGDL